MSVLSLSAIHSAWNWTKKKISLLLLWHQEKSEKNIILSIAHVGKKIHIHDIFQAYSNNNRNHNACSSVSAAAGDFWCVFVSFLVFF